MFVSSFLGFTEFLGMWLISLLAQKCMHCRSSPLYFPFAIFKGKGRGDEGVDYVVTAADPDDGFGG